MDIYAFLEQHNVEFERTDHPPVYTCEQAEKLVPPMRGADTKNLFVRDKKGRNHFLVIVGYEKSVDLKALSRELGMSGLSLGSADRLQNHLGVEPGSVSLLAIANDQLSQVEIIIDEKLWVADRWKCHPLVNTSTLSLSRNDVERILNITNHAYRVIDVPEPAGSGPLS